MNTCVLCPTSVPNGWTVCANCAGALYGPWATVSAHANTPSPTPPSLEPVEQDETIMAHRIWRWTAEDGLVGPIGDPWKSSSNQAICRVGVRPGHVAPFGWGTDHNPLVASCMGRCGINAHKLTHPFSYEDMLWACGYDGGRAQPVADCFAVIGIIELGGIVDEYEKGYRAEYGQIQELTVLTRLPVDTSSLEDKYEVPVRCMGYDAWREEWEATYGRDRETSTEDSDTETGTSQAAWTIPSVQTTGTLTFSSTPVQGSITNLTASIAGTQRLLDNLKADRARYAALPRWKKLWERFSTSIRLDWRGYVAGAAFLVGIGHVVWASPEAAVSWLIAAVVWATDQWLHYR